MDQLVDAVHGSGAHLRLRWQVTVKLLTGRRLSYEDNVGAGDPLR